MALRLLRPLSLALLTLAVPAPAHALDWTWSASRVVTPSGAGCGATAVETVDARPGAFDLQPLTTVGTPVHDATGFDVVARVTSAAPVTEGGVPGVAFTLTGSDALCESPGAYLNGWDGEPLRLRIRYTRRERVYFHEFASTGERWVRQRPRWIDGGSDFGWVDVRWSNWGGPTAEGRGAYYYIDKSGPRYRTIRYPQRFVLSNPQPCGTRLRYLRWERVRTTRRPTSPPLAHRTVVDLACRDGQWGG